MRRLFVLGGLWLLGCAAAPETPPAAGISPQHEIRTRVCEVVVASYYLGVRPSEVSVPVSLYASAESARVTLAGQNVPLAETCLGLPVPRAAPVAVLPAPTPPLRAAPAEGEDPLTTYRTNERPKPKPAPMDSRF